MNPNIHSKIISTPLLTDQQPSTSAQQKPAGKKIARVQCEICGITCSKKSNLNAHRKNIHGPNRKIFECPECNKNFVSKYNRDRHIKIEHKKKLLDQETPATSQNNNILNTATATATATKECDQKQTRTEAEEEAAKGLVLLQETPTPLTTID